MDPKIAPISKRVWNIVKSAICMIRKGLCKRKIFMELNMMMKQGKITGKALGNLMFHHNHHHNIHRIFAASRGGPSKLPNDAAPREYEFSCSNTPLYRQYFTKRSKHHQNNTNQQLYMPSPYFPLEDGENVDLDEVNNVLEMMLRNDEGTPVVSSASPALPGLGLGRSPLVRQPRITDSPFPVQNSEENKHVDAAAEDFINKFYSQLKQQKYF